MGLPIWPRPMNPIFMVELLGAGQSALMFLDLITPAHSASSPCTKLPSAAGSM